MSRFVQCSHEEQARRLELRRVVDDSVPSDFVRNLISPIKSRRDDDIFSATM